MAQPRIVAKQPTVLSLDPGTYYWCLCGRSRDQPFCDGCHEGTGIEPDRWSVQRVDAGQRFGRRSGRCDGWSAGAVACSGRIGRPWCHFGLGARAGDGAESSE